jgi:SAM-dependent methyltransferase
MNGRQLIRRGGERVSRMIARRRPTFDYAALYERVAASTATDADVIGGGDFDLIGRLELGALLDGGLRPDHVLVDFGCGSGRLALHALPFLAGGEYVGMDISETMLRRAQQNIAEAHPDPPCRVTWLQSTGTTFPLRTGSADFICAFSVFTHIEHEDSYRCLVDALRVVRPGGRFVLSCLPLELDLARQVFRESASVPLAQRWSRARNVATSRDFMDAISELAGWQVVAWYRGDEPKVQIAGIGERGAFGQSICVLERPES